MVDPSLHVTRQILTIQLDLINSQQMIAATKKQDLHIIQTLLSDSDELNGFSIILKEWVPKTPPLTYILNLKYDAEKLPPVPMDK